MEAKEKECRNPNCENKFTPYKTTDKYCSGKCAMKCKKPDLKLKPVYKPIKKVSEKRKIENLKYAAQRIIFLGKPKNKICPVTGKETTEIHHKKGRTGSLFLDENYWLAVSREGHRLIEENPEWAKEKGYSIDRLSKTENKAIEPNTKTEWRIGTPKTIGELREALKCYKDATEIWIEVGESFCFYEKEIDGKTCVYIKMNDFI